MATKLNVLIKTHKEDKPNSGKWPTWCTVSSTICLYESSTCFQQLCAHPHEDRVARNM